VEVSRVRGQEEMSQDILLASRVDAEVLEQRVDVLLATQCQFFFHFVEGSGLGPTGRLLTDRKSKMA
jgi:hypothetical protein